jgi:putative transposase
VLSFSDLGGMGKFRVNWSEIVEANVQYASMWKVLAGDRPQVVHWYAAYTISYRQLEEMTEEHGVEVDHVTLNRWMLQLVPLLDQEFRARKYPIFPSWRMGETYVRVKGRWKYLYRTVDSAGATVDFLMTAKRDRKAAPRFLRKAIGGMERLRRSRSTRAAPIRRRSKPTMRACSRQRDLSDQIPQQDRRTGPSVHQAVDAPMPRFKSFGSAAVTLAGIELIHMIRKSQLRTPGETRPARQFHALAG